MPLQLCSFAGAYARIPMCRGLVQFALSRLTARASVVIFNSPAAIAPGVLFARGHFPDSFDESSSHDPFES